MTIKITVIGLHQVGASIGMALAAHKEKINRVGIDPEPTQGQKWGKSNAFDHLVYNLNQAVSDADAVILALPAEQVEETLKNIAGIIKPGAVVLDTSPNRQKAVEWARQYLPAERHFVSITPVINPVYLDPGKEDFDTPHADLFQRGALVITSALDTDADAVKLATDLSRLLGAHAYFSDPLEADSITTAIETLPKLAAAALVNLVTTQPGWKDSERLTGKAFLKSTFAVDLFDEEKTLGFTALANQEHTLRLLNGLIAELQEMKALVQNGDQETLHETLEKSKSRHEEWLDHRTHPNWDAYPDNPLPSTRDALGSLFGIKTRNKK